MGPFIRALGPGRLAVAAVAAALLTIGPRGLARQSAGLSLEVLLSAPFTSEIVAAPSGARVAWVFDEQGARNVWVAEGPAFTGRRLTTFKEDDGQDITDLAFTADGGAVVYVRGGAPNRAGDIPNPTSAAGGADQAVWAVSTSGGAPVRIGDGSAPAVSPKGDRVAFVRRGRIWLGNAGPGAPPAAEAAAIRGGARRLTWSPDGTRLAFVSARGDHAFVGVLDTASKAVTWLGPSLDSDDAPAWSPDGTRVAFVRRPPVRDRLLFFPEREGAPWALHVADARTGVSREVWRAPEGRGSVFYSGDIDEPLRWTADDRLVFPWERDGWLHLYSVESAGGTPALLTPGDFEIDSVSYTADGRAAVVSSNQEDLHRRHLWRVTTAAAAAPAALTSGSGLEWFPAVLADGTSVAYVHGDARRPGQPAVLSAGKTQDLAPTAIPPSFPAQALVEPQAVLLTAADGMQVPAQLFRPPGLATGQRRPALVFFHGGSRRQMLLGWHYLSYYHHTYAFNQLMASNGYVVLSVNYRSGTGYGLEFREALGYGAAGASEFNDVVGAGLYLASQPDVDASRIGVWGGSYGGYLTAMALSRASGMFAAGVDVHGVHDWNNAIRNFMPSYDPARRPELARRAFEASPMAFVDGWRSPVLLVHGDDDRNVPFSESVELVERLRARKVHTEQLVFPDEVHGFLMQRSWRRLFTAAADFLDRQLASRHTPAQP
ncbi:MAG: prolyl oligopeptidase family serine peptidase [Vicinamibacterales bacterium]